MSGLRLRTVVADTSALVSLAVARADAASDTKTAPDPLQYLLSSCDVFVPPEGVTELRDLTQYQDIHGAAATNVLAARDYYAIEDPYERAETPDSRPTFGLDDGETDGIVLANALDVDASSPTSSAGRTSRSSTQCSRGRASCRRRGSSVITPGTDI
nr:hypothetical protein [Natronomonas salina]